MACLISQGSVNYSHGQIWPVACLYAAHELRKAFIFLKGYKKKNKSNMQDRPHTWPMKPEISTIWPFALKPCRPLFINSFTELRRDGQFLLEGLDVHEHSKCSDKSCGKETCLPSLNPFISQTSWAPRLPTPQRIHKQPLECVQGIESKLRVMLQALQNLASTCPCGISSLHDPQGTACSC